MQGYCPYCNLQLECPPETPGMNCLACVQRVIIRDGKFLTLEQAKNQSASVHGDSVLFSPLPISDDKEKASLPEAVKGMQKKTEKWNAVVPILFYAFFTLTGYLVILNSARAIPHILVYIGLALPGLIIYGGNHFLVHKTGKHYLKGWKKRSIYGLSAAISVLVAIPYIVFDPESEAFKSSNVPTSSVATVSESPLPQPALSAPAIEPEPVVPMSKQEAREYAIKTYNRLDELEDKLVLVMKMQDRDGYYKYVNRPLLDMMGEWPRSRDLGNEAMQPYDDCFLAINALSNAGSALTLYEGIELVQEFEEQRNEFAVQGASCKRAIDRNIH